MKIKAVILAGMLLAASLLGACGSQPQPSIPSSPDATKPSLSPGETILLSSAVSLGEVIPQPYAKELDIKQVDSFQKENDLPSELKFGWNTDGYAVGYKQAYRYDPNDPNKLLRDGSMLELFIYEKDAQGNWVERGSILHEDYVDYNGEFMHSEKYWVVRLSCNAEGNQERYVYLKAVAKDSGAEIDVVRVQQLGDENSGIYDPKMIDERLYYHARTRASEDPNNVLYRACWDEIYSVDMATMEKTRIYQSKNPSLIWTMMMMYNVDNREIYLTEAEKNQLYMRRIDLTDGSVSERVFEAEEKDSIYVGQMDCFDRFIYFKVGGSSNNLYFFDPDRHDFYTIPNVDIPEYPELVGNHLYLQTVEGKKITIYRYDLVREQPPAAVILDMSTMGGDNLSCSRFQEAEGKLLFELTRSNLDGFTLYDISIEF